jgi:hypothetical protein
MTKAYTCIFIFWVCFFSVAAQNGCPGCTTNLPPLQEDTVYIGRLADGEIGKNYDFDVSFRMPKTTTPVRSIDGVTPAGLPISKIEIVGVDGLPEGLNWQPNQINFNTGAGETDGCVKICGIPQKADSFLLNVRIKATVFVIQQESSFPMRLYIAPKKKITDGFTMSNFEGCAPLTVQFTNNVPSKDSTGFSYSWNYGDSTVSTQENPGPHTYQNPGTYLVRYQALIDTVGPVLESITLLEVDCTDPFNEPDLYCFIKAPSGEEVFSSSQNAISTPVPVKIFLNLPLKSGNYTLFVQDEDSGIKGPDDKCGSVPFNTLSGDTLTAGGLKVVLGIRRPIDTVLATDTIVVFPPAVTPVITTPFGVNACIGTDSVVLVSSVSAGITWWSNGRVIPGATSRRYRPAKSGWYRALHTNTFGCEAFSDSVQVRLSNPPVTPVYRNVRNVLTVQDVAGAAPDFLYQWFLDTMPIAGATRTTYCARQSGPIGVRVTNTLTGCSSFYSTIVQLDPNGVNCSVGTEEALSQSLHIFPNPASGHVQLTWETPLSGNGNVLLWDLTGRQILSQSVGTGTTQIIVPLPALPQGAYFLELRTPDFRGRRKLIVQGQ